MTTDFLLTESYENDPDPASGDDATVVHERIEWLEIDGEGNERTRTGSVWAAGPPLAGESTVWVLPDHPDDSDRSTGLLVALVARWRQVGRVDPRNGRWFAKTGRYVAKGLHVRESHPKAGFVQRERCAIGLPDRVRPRARPDRAEMDAYLRTIERLSGGRA